MKNRHFNAIKKQTKETVFFFFFLILCVFDPLTHSVHHTCHLTLEETLYKMKPSESERHTR